MKPFKKITHDVYNIVDRIKKMDYRYSIFYDYDRDLYFLFEDNFCSVCLGHSLDKSSIDKVFFSHVRNKYKILDKMEQENNALEQKNMTEISKKTHQQLKDYIEYADRKGKDVDFSKANTTFWL